jgi:predicted cupin superfamily sugar epimerase
MHCNRMLFRNMTLYAYATPNAQLIEDLGLQKHPEGGQRPSLRAYSFDWLTPTERPAGYFAETDRQSASVPSPFAGQAHAVCCMPLTRADCVLPTDGAARPLATSIYYLLCPDSPEGFLHMNKSVVSTSYPCSHPNLLRSAHRHITSSTKAGPSTR